MSNEPNNTIEGIEADVPVASEVSTDSAEAGASGEPDATERVSSDRAARKVREGVVVSNAMEKTAVVAVVERVRHPKYDKFVLQTKKLYAHDEANDANVGDRVRVMETRPLSKHKRWRLTEILERAR